MFIQRIHDSVLSPRKIPIVISVLKNYFDTKNSVFDFTMDNFYHQWLKMS